MDTDLKRICDDFVKNHYFSGTCLIKQDNNILLEYACGMAHKGFQIPNNIDTKFNTASITKVFTAVAVLQMIEQGTFSLTDKITDLVDLSGTKIPNDVTVEHLLTHSSGIANDVDDDESYNTYFLDLPNYSIRNTADFLPYFLYSCRLPFLPSPSSLRRISLPGVSTRGNLPCPRDKSRHSVFRPPGYP